MSGVPADITSGHLSNISLEYYLRMFVFIYICMYACLCRHAVWQVLLRRIALHWTNGVVSICIFIETATFIMQSVGIAAHAWSFQLPLLNSDLGFFHIQSKFAIRLCNISAAALVNTERCRKQQWVVFRSVFKNVKAPWVGVWRKNRGSPKYVPIKMFN